MTVTPEMVRAEMDYRLDSALSGARLDHLREARLARRSQTRRPSWRRWLDQHRRGPVARENEVRLAG